MEGDALTILKQKFPALQQQVLLKEHTTFKIGGPAEYFLIATKKQEVIDSIAAARSLGIPIFVMGGGSNLVFADEGVKGLVVKIKNNEPIKIAGENIIEAPAGAVLGDVVQFSIDQGLKGLEWAGGLPGSFGGGIRGNAGAFGGELKDIIFEVEALDENLNLVTLFNADCQFSYRNSIFKQKNLIVLSAKVLLKPGVKEELRAITNSRIQYRKDKHPLEYPNAGSVFKGVPFVDIPEEFKELFRDKVKDDPFPVVPAAWFIIEAGLVEATVGGAQFSKKHANYIVNKGNAKAQDIVQLVELAQQTVKEKFKIDLEVEVQFLGF